MTSRIFAIVIASLAGSFPSFAHCQSITLNQVDTFDPANPPPSSNWSIGVAGFTGPTVVAGGPTGNYLELSSGAFPLPPRWIMFNQVQWTGNYTATTPDPVNTIEMDIANFSATVASMRIAIKPGGGMTAGYTFIGGAGTNGAHDVPADGIFRHYVFPISSATMAPVNDPFGGMPLPFGDAIQAVGELRILQSVNPALNGDLNFVGRIGVDNIRATFIVPEPTGILAAGALALGLANVIRRRRRVLIQSR